MSMWNINARVQKLDTRDRRIIAVSDIHANMPYFRGLLEKISFSDADELIIDGDFLEKGEKSLETLRFIMKLAERGNCRVVCGNCDTWADVLDAERQYWSSRIVSYMLFKKSGLMWDILTEMGVEIREDMDFERLIPEITERFKPEWDFLHAMPHVIETPHYIFAHGGIKPDIPIERQRGGDCMKFDAFMNYGYTFDKWVIVGHWPVMLYLADHVCANPIIDREHHVISIDGGCVLKDDGQLNALILRRGKFTSEWYDPFPLGRALDAQKKSARSAYIRWGDNAVEPIELGREWCRIRHIRTGYVMDVPTDFLYESKGVLRVNDVTDYRPAIAPGETLSIVRETDRGYWIKKNGVSGWYSGRIERL